MVALAGIFAGADDFGRASTALCSSFQYINGANRRVHRARLCFVYLGPGER